MATTIHIKNGLLAKAGAQAGNLRSPELDIMPWTDEQLSIIFDKTDGTCRYCAKQLAFANHGAVARRGAWQVDHSRSRFNGGTDHLNNLYAACVECNDLKGSRNGQTVLRQLREAERAQTHDVIAGIGLAALLLAAAVWLATRQQPPAPSPDPWDGRGW